MSNKMPILFSLLLFLAASPTLAADGVPATWQAGAARATITPTHPMPMSGYASRTEPASGTRTELWAKALVLQDATGNRGLILTLDLVGIDRSLSSAICAELEDKLDLKREQIAICTSHTHTGPVVGKLLGTMHYSLASEAEQASIKKYTETLRKTIIEISEQAVANLQECELAYGLSTATFATNRRDNRPESEVPSRRTAGTLAGPFDHSVPVLTVRDSNNELQAILFGYACHATTLGDQLWSGDYPGFAQQELEAIYPGCQAMFWAGCGADQNPLPRRTPELAAHYGRRLATAVDAAIMTTEMLPLEPTLKTTYSEIDLAFGTLPTEAEIDQQIQSKDRFVSSRGKQLKQQLADNGSLDSTYPYPIQTWSLGSQLQFVFLGGEVVVDYSLAIQATREQPTWVAGYSNDVMAYIPSRRVLQEGGYEGGGAMVYYGLPTAWAPTVEKQIMDEIKSQQSVLQAPSETPTSK